MNTHCQTVAWSRRAERQDLGVISLCLVKRCVCVSGGGGGGVTVTIAPQNFSKTGRTGPLIPALCKPPITPGNSGEGTP